MEVEDGAVPLQSVEHIFPWLLRFCAKWKADHTDRLINVLQHHRCLHWKLLTIFRFWKSKGIAL